MYFDVFDYPKFVTDTPYGSWCDVFEDAGFKTFRLDLKKWGNGQLYWLDDYEYTWFLLRYG
jgi:hypothetical protein